MWECIKSFHVPHPIRTDGAFTVSMLPDHLREFKLRPYRGDLRGVNQSVPAENTWLSATRKKDGVLNPSDPDAPITISFRAIHRELHYFDMTTTWQTKSTQDMFNAMLDEWQRQVVHLGHAWRCYNQKVDDEGDYKDPMTLETTINDLTEQNTKLGRERAAAVNHFTCILALAPAIFRWKAKLGRFWQFSELARTNTKKINDYVTRVQQSLLLTSEILENHGYNVINVEEGNHGEIKKRNKCCLEGVFDYHVGDPSWWRTDWTAGCSIWVEESSEVWRRSLATRAPQGADPGVGYNPRPNRACTEGQQIWAMAASRTTAWIQGTVTTLSIGTTTTAEGKTDITIGTIKTECIGITVIGFSWATTTTATGGTQTSGKAHAKA